MKPDIKYEYRIAIREKRIEIRELDDYLVLGI